VDQLLHGETELQLVDRHYNDLLGELRVAQTGVQALERRVGAQLVLDHRLHGGERHDQQLAERDQAR
jgi:hypothetical protein